MISWANSLQEAIRLPIEEAGFSTIITVCFQAFVTVSFLCSSQSANPRANLGTLCPFRFQLLEPPLLLSD
jgi:hypothetical protein